MSQDHDNKTVSVLIVEDNRDLLELYSGWVSQYYSVEAANTGKAAINVILGDEKDFDIVLLDRNLPDIPGSDVLEVIHRHGRNCRVALITGVEPETDILDMDFDAYVEKPISQDQVYDVIEKLYQRTRFTSNLSKYYALAEKLATLKMYHTEEELKEEQGYENLLEQMDELEAEMNHSVDFNDPTEVEQIIYDAVNQT